MAHEQQKPKYAVEIYVCAEHAHYAVPKNPVVYLSRHEDEQAAAEFALGSYHHGVDHINVYPLGAPVEFRPAARRVGATNEEN